jgi:hypothetical protein
MDWLLNERGNVILPPLASFQTAIAAETGVAVQLSIAAPGEAPPTGSTIVQVGMTPDQALEFAQTLRATALHILSPGQGIPH